MSGCPDFFRGTVNKTGLLLICTVATAAWTWNRFLNAGDPEAALSLVGPLIAVGAIGGFIVALVTIFKKEWSPITAPIYALLELVPGGISPWRSCVFQAFLFKAVALTFGTLVMLLLVYRSGIIRVPPQVSFGRGGRYWCHRFVLSREDRATGIFRSALVPIPCWRDSAGDRIQCGDCDCRGAQPGARFHFIHRGAQAGAPKYMEWYAAFGLMVHLDLAVSGNPAAGSEQIL